jgi:hypothetical protein
LTKRDMAISLGAEAPRHQPLIPQPASMGKRATMRASKAKRA